MTIPAATRRELQRWYKLIDHPTQLSLINDDVRFKTVPAGRRSGKTERAKRYIVRAAMANPNGAYFLGAPTRDQAKKIFWKDLKSLSLSSMHQRTPSESDLRVYFDNGATIDVLGMDKPERIEGTFWSGGVIDEIANCKPKAWAENIRPALDTFDPRRPEYKAWCWLIGVPEGLNHYYDLDTYARESGDPDWESYLWPSADILPKATVDAARRQLSPKQFRQEYEGSFETAAGRIYEDYGPANHCTEEIEKHEQLHWYHDFNYTPLSSGIGVVREGIFYLLDEIILTSAVARQSALEFVDKYQNHENRKVLIYGDPAGRAGEKHGHASDYTDIEKVLRDNGWAYQRKVKPKAPAIKDRQNAVRAQICNALGEVQLFVNIKRAVYNHRGLATVQLKDGSTFLEQDGDYQHITTAIGYMIDYERPINRPVVSTGIGQAM